LIKVAIDATNIRAGGGLTHLSQLLSVASPRDLGIEAVTVLSSESTAKSLPDRPWLVKKTLPWMNASGLRRLLGQQLLLHRELADCDILYSPGGMLPLISPIPVVTMSQNMLPFEPSEASRFGYGSGAWFKMKLLRVLQGRSFKRADGIIFLTEYARRTIGAVLGGFPCPTALIPHGIEQRFRERRTFSREVQHVTGGGPFRLLYVSILMPYKHQIEVAYAVHELRQQGLSIELTLVGESWGKYGSRVASTIKLLDPKGEYIKMVGHVAFDLLHAYYHRADGFIFASSCENLPNILVEAMAAGLPVACSNRGPMPEVLGGAGIYFDPDSVDSIAGCLSSLVTDGALRSRLSVEAVAKSRTYSWSDCAKLTFSFLATIAITTIRRSHRDAFTKTS
jgi:glycosyltransferase involved in cell wall biosynthesis